MILALFIVVLVTAIVVSVSWRFTLSMALNENRWHGAQARLYLEGAEQLAIKVLEEDAQESQIDWLGEPWAQEGGTPMPTDEGWVMGRLEDAHGRINLNRLVAPTPVEGADEAEAPAAGPGDRFSPEQRRFIRLLQMLELESGTLDVGTAIEITEAVQDWITPGDNTTGFGGAGRSYYDSLDPPYPMSNAPMASVSELSIVRGMTAEIYEQLLPYVIALPYEAEMNINTIPDVLWRTFNFKDDLLPLSETEAEMLVQARNELHLLEMGITDVNEFMNSENVQYVLGAGEEGVDTRGLTVQSHYFLLFSETLVGEQVRRGKSLLFRGPPGQGESSANPRLVRVVKRTDANF